MEFQHLRKTRLGCGGLNEEVPHEVFSPWVRWGEGPSNLRFVATSSSSSHRRRRAQNIVKKNVPENIQKLNFPGLRTLRLAIWTIDFQFFQYV